MNNSSLSNYISLGLAILSIVASCMFYAFSQEKMNAIQDTKMEYFSNQLQDIKVYVANSMSDLRISNDKRFDKIEEKVDKLFYRGNYANLQQEIQ